jgi:hypothetical protein
MPSTSTSRRLCWGAEEVRQYQLYLINDKKLAAQTVKVRMSALRFFYWKTLKRRDIYFDDLPLPKTPKRLPTVLALCVDDREVAIFPSAEI